MLARADAGGTERWLQHRARWERRPNGRLKLSGDEFVYRGGRWVGSPEDSDPGCRLPDAAAAIWQIDISVRD